MKLIWSLKLYQTQKSMMTNPFHVTLTGIKFHLPIPQYKIESICHSSLKQGEKDKIFFLFLLFVYVCVCEDACTHGAQRTTLDIILQS